MSFEYNKNNKTFAQTLRANMTKEDRKLWFMFLSKLPIKVHRQKMIGNYILDFYCAKAKTAIEIDGSQHYESDGVAGDKERDEFLQANGISVLRYSNRDVNENFNGVCEDIFRKLQPIR